MREKRRLREKLMAMFLMAAVTVTMIPAGFALNTDMAQAATAYSYTVVRPTIKVNGHKTHATRFTVSSLGLTGACAQMGNRAKNGKATVTRMSSSDQRVKLMYYYGFEKGYLNQTNKNAILLSRAISWLSGNSKVSPLSLSEVKSFINAMPASVTVPNRFECYKCNPTNGSQDFIAAKLNPPAYVTLNKTSTDAFALSAGTGYSFEGIEYTVYYSSGAVAGKLTCRANGTTNTLTLDTGSYTVRETKTNQWYKLNPQAYTRSLGSGQTWAISAADSPETGTIHIKKSVKGSYDGSLAFDFKLTNTANAAIVYRVKTDAQTGEADVQVVKGTYRCEEVLSGDAEFVDITGPQTASVEIGETVTFERENKEIASGVLQIRKTTNDGGSPAGFRFKVSGELYNHGSLAAKEMLEAAEPAVTDYDRDVYELEEWKVSDDDLAELNKAAADRETGRKTVKLSSTLKYKGETGTAISDIVGALSGEETEGKIAGGKLISDNGKVYKAKDEVAFAVVFAEKPETDAEPAAREIDKEKTAEGIRELLKGDSFEEVDTSDVEVTAEAAVDLKPVEYVYDSENPESSAYETDTGKQIKNKRQSTEDRGKYRVTWSGFDWFGAATVYKEIKNGELTENTEVMVETGAGGSTPELSEGITYGRFTVEEVMTDAQRNKYRQPQSQTKEITRKDGKAAFIFSFENEARWTGVELLKTSSDGNVAGITFRLEGKNSSGEKVDLEAVTDKDGKIDFGNLYAGEYVISEKDFDPQRYENNYRLEGYKVPAQKLVVTGDETESIKVKFENVPLKSLYITKVDKETRLFLKNAVFELLEGDKQLALFRIVLDDYGQAGIDMIKCDEDSGLCASIPQVSIFPENDTGDNEEGEPGEAGYNFAVLKGLKEGKTYTIREVTAPTGYAAAINEDFVFEDGKKLILENAAPVIGTTASDKATGMQMSNAEGMVTIVDTVSYTNLGPGHKYIMSGILASRPMGERTPEQLEDDADIIEILKDAKGNEITAEKEFVPDSPSGTIDIEFTFDASLLDGKQAVAMEQLVDPALTGVNGTITIVASHEDIEDEAQSIYFPEVRTKAIADDTGKQITEADGEVIITDTVDYSNVIAGKIYRLTGTLMDKDTGKPIVSGGNAVTSSVEFRAEKDGPVFASDGEKLTETAQDKTELVSGTVELKFQFDGSNLAGKQAVAFEKLTTGGKLVGEHSNLNDEVQTVNLPTILTTASTNGTDTVSDKVEYTNLIPGETYVMRGVLMDKATGRELLLDGNPVTAEMNFVPEKKDGSIKIDFPVSVRELEGKSAVVFETCSMVMAPEGDAEAPVEVEVISHKDINNKAQTVTFDVPQTGQRLPWSVPALAGLFAAAAAFAAFRRIRRGGLL